MTRVVRHASALAKPRRALIVNSVVAAIAIAANVGLVASMAWSWTTRGRASADPGYRLASRLLAGRFDVFVGRWAGALLFLIPLCGAFGLVAVAAGTRKARYTRIGISAVALLLSVAVVSAIRVKVIDRLGVGGWLAIVGSTVALLTAIVPERG